MARRVQRRSAVGAAVAESPSSGVLAGRFKVGGGGGGGGGGGANYRNVILADSPVAFWTLDQEPPATGATQWLNEVATPNSYMNGYGSGVDWDRVPTPLSGDAGGYAIDVFEEGARGDVPGWDWFPFSALTLECWYAATVATAGTDVLWSKYNSAAPATSAFRIRRVSGSANVICEMGNGSVLVAAPTIPGAVDELIHGAWTFDGSAIRAYKNGVQQGAPVALAGPLSSANVALRFLNGTGVLNQTWWGLVDNPAIYPSALSAERLAAHYAAGVG